MAHQPISMPVSPNIHFSFDKSEDNRKTKIEKREYSIPDADETPQTNASSQQEAREDCNLGNI